MVNYATILTIAKEGNWDKAHQQVQSHSNPMACLIHGYLHRVEGDMSNAHYWYRRANETMPNNSLEDEWNRLYSLTQSD